MPRCLFWLFRNDLRGADARGCLLPALLSQNPTCDIFITPPFLQMRWILPKRLIRQNRDNFKLSKTVAPNEPESLDGRRSNFPISDSLPPAGRGGGRPLQKNHPHPSPRGARFQRNTRNNRGIADINRLLHGTFQAQSGPRNRASVVRQLLRKV
jgi:hypothetical protein